jgi:aspartyl-tRNA(Asn)/glutamyl-tRNA(Gln) amidotransferase subunit A
MTVRDELDTRGRQLGAVIAIVPIAGSAHFSGSAHSHERDVSDPEQLADPLPLAGVPVAIKANIAVSGQAWSAAIGARRDLVSPDDAPVVTALRHAGADVVAMLNMAEAALGATTNNEAFGIGRNPHDEARTCGGSSGGSGAVVGAGLVPLALGTDTMGSVRVPASYCGCVGFKPSNGLVPLTGVVPLATLLDCVGPLATDVTTAINAMRVLCAPMNGGPWSGRTEHFDWDKPPALPRRVIVPTEVLAHDLEPAVDAAFENVVDLLRANGVEILEHPLGIDLALLRRRGLLLCEAEGAAFHANLLATDPEGFSSSLRSMLAFGASKSAVDLARALTDLQEMGEQIGNALKAADADGFLTPTTPQVAFPVDAPVPADQANFTAFANVAGLPAISLPCGRDSHGMPIGVQLVGRRLADDTLAAHALALEALLR